MQIPSKPQWASKVFWVLSARRSMNTESAEPPKVHEYRKSKLPGTEPIPCDRYQEGLFSLCLASGKQRRSCYTGAERPKVRFRIPTLEMLGQYVAHMDGHNYLL